MPDHKIQFRLAFSTPTRGMSHGIFTEYGGNAEDIPYSVAPVQSVFYFRDVVRWKP